MKFTGAKPRHGLWSNVEARVSFLGREKRGGAAQKKAGRLLGGRRGGVRCGFAVFSGCDGGVSDGFRWPKPRSVTMSWERPEVLLEHPALRGPLLRRLQRQVEAGDSTD